MPENIYIDKFGPCLPNNPPPDDRGAITPAITSGSFFGEGLTSGTWAVPVERYKPELPELFYLTPPVLPAAILAGSFFYEPDQNTVILALPMPDKWLPELPDLYLDKPFLNPAIIAGSIFEEIKGAILALPCPDKWMPETPDLYFPKPELSDAIRAQMVVGDIMTRDLYRLLTIIPSGYLGCIVTAMAVDTMDRIYLGTERGEVWKYNSGTLTRIKSLDSKILDIELFGAGLLYVSTANGQFHSLTTS